MKFKPPLMLALSVWTAGKHALSFVSKGEVVRLNLPATNEEVLTRLTHYTRQTKLEAGKVMDSV